MNHSEQVLALSCKPAAKPAEAGSVQEVGSHYPVQLTLQLSAVLNRRFLKDYFYHLPGIQSKLILRGVYQACAKQHVFNSYLVLADLRDSDSIW